MWVFAPFGLLMPAAVPMDKADPIFTEDGKYDLQVRGRLAEHLRYFMDNYMPAGTFHPVIELTPGMDYNVRFYTTREAFAEGMAKAIADIDYKKFKPTAETKNEDGTNKYGKNAALYHSVLNSMWGTVTRLGAPGGMWASPHPAAAVLRNRGVGHTMHYSHKDEADQQAMYADDEYREYGNWRGTKSLVSTWDEIDPDDPNDTAFKDNWSMPDYTPRAEEEAKSLLREAHDAFIPVDQWVDYFTEHEYTLLKPYIKAARKQERREDRKIRRLERRGYIKRGRTPAAKAPEKASEKQPMF